MSERPRRVLKAVSYSEDAMASYDTDPFAHVLTSEEMQKYIDQCSGGDLLDGGDRQQGQGEGEHKNDEEEDDELRQLEIIRDEEQKKLNEVHKKSKVEDLKRQIMQIREATKTAEVTLAAGTAQQKEGGAQLNLLRPSRQLVNGGAHGAVGAVNHLQNSKLASQRPQNAAKPRDT